MKYSWYPPLLESGLPWLCQSIAWFLCTRVESSPCHLELYWVRANSLDVWVVQEFGLGGSLARQMTRTSANRRAVVSVCQLLLMSVQDQMLEWSSVWSGKVPSKPSPALQLMWPALKPSSLHCSTAVCGPCVLPGHDGEANQAGGGASDSKVVKNMSSKYSRINIYIFHFKELLLRTTTQTKTTATDVAVYCPSHISRRLETLIARVN